jgi:pimeloyl-ACP methyl ester carboxylesterase
MTDGLEVWDATRVETNGVELSVHIEGEGPTVFLCHGFPEIGFSWRYQVPALAAAGYRVVVPDMRGYGSSSRPTAVEDYDIFALTGDMVGLLDWIGEEQAIFVGHDWGASMVWSLAMLNPERVEAVAGLSVPFAPRPPVAPLSILRRRLGDDFYMLWFQDLGVADAALARDVRRTLTTHRVWTAEWAQGTGENPPRPPWLTQAELDVYVAAFEQTGFSGGLNYYRNIDRNWEMTEVLDGQLVEQPSMFLTGEHDLVRQFMPAAGLDAFLPNLRLNRLIPGAGNWIQQERPEVVTCALLEFLEGLD